MDASKKSLMDGAWRRVYDNNSCKNLPIHSMSCWTEQGFNELFKVTFSLIKNLKGVSSVLDVGCGPGVYCAEFHKQGFDVVGVDYAENVIKKASKDNPSVKFVVGDAYDLPFNDAEFDLVSCVGVLQCVYEPEKIVKELTRVSKKYVLVSTLLRQKKLDDPLRFLHKKLETDDWPTKDYHPAELEVLFEREGFHVTTILKSNNSLITDGFFIIATKKLS